MPAWSCKATGGYSSSSTEGQNNGINIATLLLNSGFALRPAAAVLGSSVGEGGLNPWRWESDQVPTMAQFNVWSQGNAKWSHGYGLFGFTPANRYINSTSFNNWQQYGYGANFSDRPGSVLDGQAQVMFFLTEFDSAWNNYNLDHGANYRQKFATIGIDASVFMQYSASQFKADIPSLSLTDLTAAFTCCYEKPANPQNSYYARGQAAAYWYSVLSGSPITPTPPSPDPDPTPDMPFGAEFPFWLLAKVSSKWRWLN